jgi:hypothetical protein
MGVLKFNYDEIRHNGTKTYKLASITKENNMNDDLLPCPFCGTIPRFPSGLGTIYDLECHHCGQAVVSIQIGDLMSRGERDDTTFVNSRYPDVFVGRAKMEAVRRWNTRY